MRFWRLYRYFRGASGGFYGPRPLPRRAALGMAWAYARKGADTQ